MTAETCFFAVSVVFLTFVGAVTWVDHQRQLDLVRVMTGLSTRAGEDLIRGLSRTVEGQNYILRRHYETARQLHARAAFSEAAERLALGYAAIEEMAPGFLAGVTSLRRLTRTVGVVVSLDPVPHSAWRRPALRGLAAGGQFVHHLLLTGQHRMRLRLFLVAGVFRLALRGLGRASRAVSRRPAPTANWERVEGWVDDLGTAGDQAVVAARTLVVALDALELGLPVQQRA